VLEELGVLDAFYRGSGKHWGGVARVVTTSVMILMPLKVGQG
jgi:hypothetical protein